MSADIKITEIIRAHGEAAAIKRTQREIDPDSGQSDTRFMVKLRNAARRATKIQRHLARKRDRDDTPEPDLN